MLSLKVNFKGSAIALVRYASVRSPAYLNC